MFKKPADQRAFLFQMLRIVFFILNYRNNTTSYSKSFIINVSIYTLANAFTGYYFCVIDNRNHSQYHPVKKHLFPYIIIQPIK